VFPAKFLRGFTRPTARSKLVEISVEADRPRLVIG
jgi:hypothetical protein